MGDYLELYQSSDTILLAEVFESFCHIAIKTFHIDLVFLITSSHLTWNAGLRLTKIELQFLNTVDDYLWIENQISSGICMLGTRYTVAYNPHIPELYDENKEIKYTLPLDVIHLYGFIMTCSLPQGNFGWLDKEEVENFNVFYYDE